MMQFTSQEVDKFREWGNAVEDSNELNQEDALLLVKLHHLLRKRSSCSLLEAAGLTLAEDQLYY